jgi:hypothetical protein
MSSYTPQSGAYGQLGYNKSMFSRLLRRIGNFNMEYQDMIFRNQVGVGINQEATPTALKNSVSKGSDMYDVFSRNAVNKIMTEKSISYLDGSYLEKRRILREYSLKDEIRDMITQVADEAVMYKEGEPFCSPKRLSDSFRKDLKEKYDQNFKYIFNRLGFNGGIRAWYLFRKLLVDGYLAFEIVYDDKQKNIIDIIDMDAATLVPAVDPVTKDYVWIQFPENPIYRRVFLDSQIIYISYSNNMEYMETSYVENLIRPYNQLKLLEQTKIMFNIIHASMHKQFSIPVHGLPKAIAEQQVQQLIADYKDEVIFDERMGQVYINGSPHIPYSKEYWFPVGEAGKPEFQLVEQNGINLNENDMLKWFHDILKRASKLPFSRFDHTAGGGALFAFDNIQSVTRDEITFFTFIQRLRYIYKEIVIKPWKIQMVLDFPELLDDDNFLTSIDVEFKGVNHFYEMIELDNLVKKVGILATLVNSVQEEDGKPFFSVYLLVEDILKFSPEFLERNERYKKEKRGTGQAVPAEGGSSSSPTPDFSGGSSSPENESPAPEETPPSETPPPTEAPTTPEPGGNETPPPTGGEAETFTF